MSRARRNAPCEPGVAEQRSDEAESRYRDLAMACDHAVLIHAQPTIVFANHVAMGLLGATEPDQVLGQSIDRFFALPDGDGDLVGRTEAANFAPVHVKRLHGHEVAPVSLMLMPCHYDGCEAMQVLVRDRRARESFEVRLSYLARNDVLTDLPNRGEFRERLAFALAAARDNRRVAVIQLSLDHFRTINEKHGNDTGDLVLQAVASRIRRAIRPGDTVARIAGDGFAMILQGLERRDQASLVINRILAGLKEPMPAGSAPVTVSASAGIAAYPDDALDLEALLRAAHLALNSAKANARGGFRFYFPEMEASNVRHEERRSEKSRLVALLTHRERDVMNALIEGHSTKHIALMLGTSPRTIESQRAQVMKKMEAESLVDLVRMWLEMNAED